ncbi:helix-turn-helix domain-containing protein [Fusobacterium necrophorum]|uniref:Cro/C1-type HTH DNA-binding domain protein n=1 Tax=Fusobacterium necrophorum subsp. funduliforme Fnf 1007 TaxID=1161424 RepID=A0AAN3VUV3_9FUSO|nr:helix-turn-helix transcriptional regulator [Fusobacterium necrophorum]EJU16117.1 Cro/C1-type HTH DNA-binding domain protein [Fusobacterium necrophorum subsp. funduliforme Fnf 1007]KYM50461.1 Cro/Cl family transcriptional regulator [Fusobacterium necrophorum subsp. funduliforme]
MLKIKVSDLMGKHKLTIAKVSELTSLSRPTISSLYHEKISRIDFETVEKLCKLFNCNVQDLIEYIPDEKPLNE